jgi:hypothetical protein
MVGNSPGLADPKHPTPPECYLASPRSRFSLYFDGKNTERTKEERSREEKKETRRGVCRPAL